MQAARGHLDWCFRVPRQGVGGEGGSTCSGMSGLLRLKTPDLWEQVETGPAPAGPRGTMRM
jgi:hypothetical protein